MSETADRRRCALLLAVALAAPLAAQKPLAEPRAGLALRPPKAWLELPGGVDRGATLRLFAAPRAITGRGEGASHTPLLRVMFLPAGGDASADEKDGLPRRSPYRSLEDFVARGFGKDARLASRSAGKAGELDGQRFEAKLPGSIGERTLYGFVQSGEAGELVVAFEVYSDQLAKLKKDFDATLDGLVAVPRDPNAAAPDPQASPELGWKASKSKHWPVLSAADPATTKKAIAAAELARDWAIAEFGALVPKSAQPAVLRIFASVDHYNAFLSTVDAVREYSPARRELWFFEDQDAGSSDGYGMLFRAVLWHALDDANGQILPALPRWLDNGLWEYLRSTKLAGKKIEFAPSEVETGRIGYQLRGNTMPALWDLIQESIQPSPADGADEEPWSYTPECARLVRWLCEHDGEKAFARPGMLGAYCALLAKAHAKLGADPCADVDTARLDDAQKKQRNRLQYAWRDALLKAVNDEYLPNEAEWRAANERWLKFNETYR